VAELESLTWCRRVAVQPNKQNTKKIFQINDLENH